MGCHCETGEPPTLADHARGSLPLVRAAWGVTARKASHNASNARGVAAGKMGRNSSTCNEDCHEICNLFSAPGTHTSTRKLELKQIFIGDMITLLWPVEKVARGKSGMHHSGLAIMV